MANENFLNIPQWLAARFEKDFPGFWGWLMYLNEFVATKFSTLGDSTHLTAGKGVVLTNKAGTITKRVFLKDDGSGVDVESV